MSSRAFRRIAKSAESPTSETVDDSSPEVCARNFFPKIEFFSDIPVLDTEEPISSQPGKKKKRPKKKPIAPKISVDTSAVTAQPDEVECIPSLDSYHIVSDLLAVKSKFLDFSLELSRLFKYTMPDKNIRTGRSSTLKRGLLVPIKRSWPPIVRFGLDMERSSNGSYTITHNKDYQKAQAVFYQALNSLDPNNIVHILDEYPYHVDSLLQLSDLLMRQDNATMAIDLLERVLHAYQSAFHPWFNPTTGSCYLDYKYQTNRGLFVALFRYASLIGTRGCYRCALDYFKVLFSLDISDDPLAVLLVLDHFSLLSGQVDFILQLYERLNPSKNLYLLPNFAFSIALAYHWKATSTLDHKNADSLLQDALIMFPGFLTRLLKHTTIGGVSNLDKSVLFGKEVQNEPSSLGRLLDLYVARSHSIWISPNIISWLEPNIAAVLGIVEPGTGDLNEVDPRLSSYSERRKTLYPSLPRNVLRHLILADLPEAPPLLSQLQGSVSIYSFDPLPPGNSVDIYSGFTDSHLRPGSHDSLLLSFLTSLFPGYSIPENGESGSAASTIGHALTTAGDLLALQIRRVLDFGSSSNNDPAETQDNSSDQH